MGGGLFGTPLYLNPKCLVFSAFVVGVYYLPKPKFRQHQWIMAFLLACSAYVMMAWYDVLFDCNDHLRPTILGWMWGWAKPPEYQKQLSELPLKYQKIIQWTDIAILLVLILTFLYPYYY